jgi:hypothetical protein
LLPLLFYNVFKQPFFLFPEAPGAVIPVFGVLINDEDLFAGGVARMYHLHDQAQASTSRTGNDIIICGMLAQMAE